MRNPSYHNLHGAGILWTRPDPKTSTLHGYHLSNAYLLPYGKPMNPDITLDWDARDASLLVDSKGTPHGQTIQGEIGVRPQNFPRQGQGEIGTDPKIFPGRLFRFNILVRNRTKNGGLSCRVPRKELSNNFDAEIDG